jgi:hypothetical protein
MRIWIASCLLVGLAATVRADDTPKPKSDKKPQIVAVDAATAGPDFAFQGEYSGGPENHKIGVQVIADGDGQFAIRALMGGLPGDGWDGKEQKQFKGKLEDGKVKFGDDKSEAVIADGKIIVMHGDSSFKLEKVTRKSPTEGAKPPEGAVVLFDGKSLDMWTKMDRKSPTSWVLRDDGVMQVKGGDIITKQQFGAFTLHVEFMLPFMPSARGQGRANSGVYVQNRYELQVLDSFALKGLNNEAGGFYQASDPIVNMCYPPLQWQTYDIDYTPAKFEDGKKAVNGRCTVKHNGVVVQDNVELKKPTPGGVAEAETPDGIHLQDHGNPLMFRNIWIVEKK